MFLEKGTYSKVWNKYDMKYFVKITENGLIFHQIILYV